jgi:hypothetical protein
MIESLKDMKHGKSSSYEGRALERTASQILHHMEGKDSEDSLESTKARVLCESCLAGECWEDSLTISKQTLERFTERVASST